jgi:hypothetical protein
LEWGAAEALASEHWLQISIESILEFLRMDFVELREAVLVRAVIRWGQYQVQTDGDDPTDGQKLRAKILPALKLIRYISLSREQFDQLCLEELGAVMNAEEKKSFRQAIVNKKWKLMPTVMATPRKTPRTLFNLEFKECLFISTSKMSGPPFTSKLIFQLDKMAKFVGLKVDTKTTHFYHFRYELYGPEKTMIGEGCDQDETIYFRNEEFFPIIPKCTLQANMKYVLRITTKYSMIENYSTFAPLSADLISITSDGLTLQIHYDFKTQMHVNVEKMLFIKRQL